MLTEIERWQQHSVESQREAYSDAELWAWLKRMKDEETKDLQCVMIAHTIAHSQFDSDGEFRRYWRALCNVLSANEPMIDLLVRHLTKREDTAVVSWLARYNETQRRLAHKAHIKAYRIVHE